MVMKPIRKCRRKEARSLTLPTVAEGSFCVELESRNRVKKVLMKEKYCSMKKS